MEFPVFPKSKPDEVVAEYSQQASGHFTQHSLPHRTLFAQQSAPSFSYTSPSNSTMFDPIHSALVGPPGDLYPNPEWISVIHGPTMPNLNGASLSKPPRPHSVLETSTWVNNPQTISPATLSSNDAYHATGLTGHQPRAFNNSVPGSGPCHHMTNNNNDAERYVCRWENCGYTGTFGREAELIRHVKLTHVSPGSFKCHVCGKSCNRADNLQGHMLRRHL